MQNLKIFSNFTNKGYSTRDIFHFVENPYSSFLGIVLLKVFSKILAKSNPSSFYSPKYRTTHSIFNSDSTIDSLFGSFFHSKEFKNSFVKNLSCDPNLSFIQDSVKSLKYLSVSPYDLNDGINSTMVYTALFYRPSSEINEQLRSIIRTLEEDPSNPSHDTLFNMSYLKEVDSLQNSRLLSINDDSRFDSSSSSIALEFSKFFIGNTVVKERAPCAFEIKKISDTLNGLYYAWYFPLLLKCIYLSIFTFEEDPDSLLTEENLIRASETVVKILSNTFNIEESVFETFN